MRRFAIILLAMFSFQVASAEETTRDFNKLVGNWKGNGTPEGSPEVRSKGLWAESVTIIWKFMRAESWLELQFTDGKLFTKGTLTRNKNADWTYRVTRPDKTEATYQGTWDGKQFQLSRTLEDKTTEERVVISPLHDNRFIYRIDTRKVGSTLWTKQYQVGHTKEGVPFANVGPSATECIVSGGRGTSTVTYMGKTYYVCCSGCRDEFKDNPKKYVDAWEAKQKK